MSSTENFDFLSITADSGDESVECFDSEDIGEAEKRLASKTAGSAVMSKDFQLRRRTSSACKKG